MEFNRQSVRNTMMKGLVGLVGAAGIGPTTVVAQDARILVETSPQVVYSGQTTRIKVYACPSDPGASNAPYAFASAAFDILADNLSWSFASDGKIVDSNVLDIEVGQNHQPELDIYADPSNPIRIWGGVFKPLSDEPAMVDIAVDPSSFFVYPSKNTSSSVQVYAQAGNDAVFLNPLSVGRWLAAPAQGTTISVADDVIVDGRIITGENWDSVSVGIVPAGTVTFFDSSTRVEFDGEPVTFTATVQGPGGDVVPTDVVSVNFAKVELNTSAHVVGANFAFGDGSVRTVRFDGFIGGVYVASGDLDAGGPNEIPGLVVDSLPQTIGAKFGLGTLTLPRANTYLGFTAVYDQPIVATIRDSKGMPQIVTLDRIDVYPIATTTEPSSSPARKILGSHVFVAEGVKGMSVTPSQGD